MKTLTTALLAGVLATASTVAFAQTVAPTTGFDYRSAYGSTADANASYASAGRTVHVRTHRTAVQRPSRAYTTGGSVGSPD